MELIKWWRHRSRTHFAILTHLRNWWRHDCMWTLSAYAAYKAKLRKRWRNRSWIPRTDDVTASRRNYVQYVAGVEYNNVWLVRHLVLSVGTEQPAASALYRFTRNLLLFRHTKWPKEWNRFARNQTPHIASLRTVTYGQDRPYRTSCRNLDE